MSDNNWSRDFFGLLYWELFMKRTPQQVTREVELISSLASLKGTETALDVCCGVGDIASALPVKSVTGIDTSQDYARIARTLHPNVHFVLGDAVQADNLGTFDIVYNWYSSFAYFEKEHNRRLLNNCRKHLKEDGTFLLEANNGYHVIRHFKECFQYVHTLRGQEYHTQRSSHIDWQTRKLHQKWTISDGSQSQSFDTFTVLYLMDEILDMLRVNFNTLDVWGRAEDGSIEDFSFDSPRFVIRAKP